MREELRFQTTAVIWGTFALIMIFAQGDKVAMAFIVGIAAAISTSMVWESLQKSSADESEKATKGKRNNRVRRLIEVMDEDEIADMEAYLDARRDDRLSR
ncbi:MAG: hypothetical protein K8I30_24205 [Anaerolineae bacterium]|nr:hypothetical protein [Anaerolineae bacterium]